MTADLIHDFPCSLTALKAGLELFKRPVSSFWIDGWRREERQSVIPQEPKNPESEPPKLKGLSSLSMPSEQLWKLEQERLDSYVQRWVRDPEVRADLVSELLLREFQRDIPESYTSIRNFVIDWFRKNKTRLRNETEWTKLPPPEPDSRHEWASGALESIITGPDGLSPREKYLVIQRFYCGLSIEALAAQMKVSREKMAKELFGITAKLKALAVRRGITP